MIEQGEFCGDPDDKGLVSGDSKRVMDERPDFVVLDGAIEKYAGHPIGADNKPEEVQRNEQKHSTSGNYRTVDRRADDSRQDAGGR
jgi:hypothetical protein